MSSLRILAALGAALAFAPADALAVPPATRAAQQAAPFIGVRVDEERNKVLLEIPAMRLDADFLHQSVLATGGGVAGLGLDRGQTGGSAVVRLERRGRRVLMVRDNWSVRATGADAAGQRAGSPRLGAPGGVIGARPSGPASTARRGV